MASKLKRRRGRPRKTGLRHRNGHLRATMAESPRERAAHMPHRRGLGDDASNPAAESELGRMRLRGEVSEPEATAGEVYARMWRGYVATLDSPRDAGLGHGQSTACVGCPAPLSRKFCICDLRKRIYAEASRVLVSTGRGVAPVVHAVVILDRQCGFLDLPTLKLGLTALAEHYGLLTNHTNRRRNAPSPKYVETVHR